MLQKLSEGNTPSRAIANIINKGNETNLSLNDAQKVNALMCADDLVILSDTKEGLQKHLDKLSEYCDKWELGTNMKKIKNNDF